MSRGLPLALAAGLLAGTARAATLDHATFSGAEAVRGSFLARGAGARAAGMGEAFTAVADDASALAWNPGGLGQLDRLHAVAGYDVLGAGMGLTTAAVAGRLLGGVAGAGVALFSFGSVEVRDAGGNLTGNESATDVGVSLGWAHANPQWTRLPGWTGLAVEAAAEQDLGAVVGVSVGGVVPLNAAWSLGWAVQHLGPAGDDGGLPAGARVGASWRAHSRLRVAADIGVPFATGNPWEAVGVEAALHRTLALRAGYKLGGDGPTGGLAGVTAGLGVVLGEFGLDYVFAPAGDIAVTHRVALSYRQRPGVAGGAPVVAGGRLNLAVAELTAQGVSASDAGVVADLLRSALIKTDAYNVVEKQNMDKILAEQGFQQTGCTNEECAVKLGKILNVQRMVVGSFGKLMDAYFVSLRVVDIQTGAVVYGDSLEARSVSDLKGSLTDLVSRLAAHVR